MGKTRKAWIQLSDYSSQEIGEVSREEVERLWGGRWAQKCIRDVAEQVAIARFSPYPRPKSEEFCSPQLGFENGEATLAVSPWIDVRPTILYGSPLQEFTTWTVYLHVKKGKRVFGVFPVDYSFEMIVSQDESLDLVRLFYEYSPEDLVERAKAWKERINERYRHRLVGAFFF